MKTKYNYIILPLAALFSLTSCYMTGFGELSKGDNGEDSIIKDLEEETDNSVTAEKVVWSGEVGDSFAFGTPYSPNNSIYYITTGEELAYLASLVNAGEDMSGKNFYLNNNIDLDNHQWTPIGYDADFNGIEFNGTFNGGEYAIKNLYHNYKESSWTGDAGLFGTIGQSGAVKQLSIKGADITCDGSFGGIASSNHGTIEECHFSGDIASDWNYTGGIAGNNEEGIITNCSSSGKIYVDPESNGGTGSEAIGGICGYSRGGEVSYCSNAMDIDTAGSMVGGIAGNSVESGNIYSCYNTGNISGKYAVGGVVGYNSNATLTSAYNRGAISGKGDDASQIGGVVGNCQDLNDVAQYGASVCTSLYNTADATEAGVIGQCFETASYCYALKNEDFGYFHDNTWTIVYDGGGSTITNVDALENDKMLSSDGLLKLLNAGSAGDWQADANGVNDSYPILVGMKY